jgi:hypothetical protein
MKVLYLVDPQQDYLTSMVFEGLCDLVGESSVYVYPMLKRWRTGAPDDDYILPDGKTGWTGKVDYELIRPHLPELTLDQICEQINDFDYIILASPREYVVKSFRYIKDKVKLLANKLVLIDGEDGANLQTQLINEFNPQYIFKREMMYETSYNGIRIYPLPFSAFLNKLPEINDLKKDLNVFSILGNTNQLRVKLVQKFHEFNIDNSVVDIDSGVADWDRNKPRHGKMAYKDYMSKIASSKIGLSCIGHGKDCVRYWEIPSYNTMMMTIDPKIIIPFPFKDKETCVIIKDDLSNFNELLEYYLSHDDERNAIAMAGHEHLMKYHTCKQRTMYMLSILEGTI